MVGLVVATHGTLSSGLKDAARMLAGDLADFPAVSLVPGKEPSAFLAELEAAIDGEDEGDGVLVLVDLFGGTPSNSVCRMLGRKGVHAVSGVNLPMVLEGIFSRGEKSAEELAEYLAQVGPGAIFDIEKRLAQNAASRTEDEDDEDFE